MSVGRVLGNRVGVLIGAVLLSTVGAGAEPVSDESPNVADVAAVIAAHNRDRESNRLGPLTANPKLEAVALAHARDMARHDKMTHEGSDGSTPAERLERQDYHYRTSGENVAMGQSTVAQAMRSWRNSPPHMKNILGDFSEIGVACVKGEDGTRFWCVNFGLPWPKLDPTEAAAAVRDELNLARSNADKRPLKSNRKLQDAAARHAHDMAAHDHYQPKDDDGLTPFERLEKTGYRFRSLAEATGSGQPTPEELVKGWLADRKQRETILGDFSEVGIGYATAEKGTPYWALILGKPVR